MQNVLAQSTSGMASNLKDAIDTMYYDIANSNSGVIKGTIKDITTLVGHWRELSAVLAAGTLVYGGHNIAMSVYNRLIGVGTAETLKGVMASKAEEASVLRRKALYGELTAEEKVIVATSKELTATDLKRLASSKAIDAEAVIRMVNTKKITAAQALQVASDLALTDGELKYLMTLRSIDMQLAISSNSWKMTYSKFTLSAYKNLLMFGKNVKSIASGIRTAMASMFTPANVAMAAIFMGLDAIMDYNQRIDKINETNKNTIKNAEDGFKNLSEFLSANPIQSTIKGGNESEISKMVDVYKEQLQSQPIDMSGFITNVDSISDATQKLIALRKEAEALKTANDEISKNGNPFAQSEKAGSTWVPDWLDNVGIKAVKILHSILPLSRGFRNMAVQWGENSKSMEGVLSDVSESMYDLQGEMSQLNKTDIDSGLQKLRALYPQLASEIDDMRRAGASNNEVILSMLQIARDKKITLFDNIDINKIDDLNNNTKVMMDRMDYYVEDGINRINSSMNRVDVERKSEAWKLAVMKSASEQAKAWNLVGDALDAWTFKNESAIAYNSARIQDHPKAYQDMYNGIKAILAKNGVDITKATKDQVNDAFRVYKEEMKRFKPYLSWWLSMLNVFSRKNPIYIWTEMRNISNEGGVVLTGRGADMWKNQAVRHAFKKEDLQDIKTNDDVVNDINSRYEQYKKDLFAAKANGQSTEKLEQGWINNVKAWESSGINVDYILSKGKTPKTKKTGTGGNKSDDLLKEWKERYDEIKKIQEIQSKLVSNGHTFGQSLKMTENSDLSLAKFIPKNISSQSEYDNWIKKMYENLLNTSKNGKNKFTKERNEFWNSVASTLLEVNESEFKKRIDEYGKKIEELISETTKKWDVYKQLTEAGMSSQNASNFAFGGQSIYGSKGEALAGEFYNQMASKGIRGKIDFGMSEDDVKTILGGSEFKDQLLKLWKSAKTEIENEHLKIQLDGQKAISQVQSVVDKIKQVTQNALGNTIWSDSKTGVSRKLKDYAYSDSKTGLLKLYEGAESQLSPEEIKIVNAYIEETNQEITKLGSQLLELLPAWDDIFGKAAYMSLEQLLRGMREAKEIVKNAKIVNDKNGKPSYFTSTYKDKDGKVQSVSGNISELDRLKNQEDTRQEDINKKNPFVGMHKSLESYFSSKKDVKYWNEISSRADKNGGTTTYTDKNGNKQTITAKDAKTKANDAQDEASRSALSFSEAMQSAIGEMQKWNNALSLLGSTIEAVGGGTGVSDAAGVAGGMLSGAMSMSSLGPWGMAAGAAMGAITGIAELHDKKLDSAIEKSKEKVKELENAYKSSRIV
jgi:hypothetical protein